MKTIINLCFLSLILGYFSAIYGQDEEYQKWLKDEQNKFNTYLSEEDKKFKDFLEKEWKEFNLYNGIKFDEKPKLTTPPVLKEQDLSYPKEIDKKANTKEKNKVNKKPVIKDNNNPFVEKENKQLTDENKKENLKDNTSDKQINDIEKTNVDKLKEKEIVQEKIKTEKINQQQIKEKETTIKQEPRNITIIPNINSNSNDQQLLFLYFGTDTKIDFTKDLKVVVSQNVNNKSISKFWEEMSKRDYQKLLKQFLDYKKALNLNDWGYAIFINNFAKEFYGSDRNSRYCFNWFMLNKSGYKSRIGFVGNRIVLFIPSVTKIFDVPYFTTSDTKDRLYVIDFDNLKANYNGAISTYDGDYPEAKNVINMYIDKAPKLNPIEVEKVIKFRYRGNEYSVNVKYNGNLVKYYENYPYTDLSVYFNYKISEDTKESLINSLRPLIEGKSTPDAANLLLRFVQVGFEYQTDDQQFGREKPLFIEEILNYSACDCEDRSILFSFLIKELLGLKVIGIDYPGHVATAVKFDVDVPGDYIMFKNQKFLICDPTYINAYIGMAMPTYKDVKYENLIEIKN